MYLKLNIKLILLIQFCYSFNLIKTDDQNNIIIYRLPNNTSPVSYNIEIKTLLDKNDFKFIGVSKITLVSSVLSTNYIAIHTKQSKLGKIKLNDLSTNKNISILYQNYNNISEILNITLSENLISSSIYELIVPYESVLRNDNLGFYRSSYVNEFDKKIWLAATQFAPTEARHAFPCYDEPQLKATFTIQITHPVSLFAISNREQITSLVNFDQTKTTKFKTTPLMSSYLVGFVISDFDKKISNQSKEFRHEIYARSNAIEYTKFAEEFGVKAFGELINYFNVEAQPINVMKQVALPDFHFSGMENWGIVTYKETVLFYKKNLHGSKRLLDLSYVMGHEMSHQWFGNLVTHKWWTYVWLKEGFSTLYGNYIIDMLYPHWKQMERYQINVMHLAFQIDQDSSIRPMTYYVDKQLDIRNNYDKIAYEKSSCVLKMFDHALNKEKGTFKAGVDIYLTEMKYKAATENDLFRSLDKALLAANEQLNIEQVLSSWTSQSGYPIVYVSINNSEIQITQERFLGYGTDRNSLWYIPINFEIENGNNFNDTTAKFWMKNTREIFTIGSHKNWDSAKNWIILNVQQSGYYRVNYDSSNWYHLINTLNKNHTSIHTHNRAQLIDDAFNLAKTNKLEYNILFELLKYLENEQEYAPWAAFNNGIELLKVRIMQTKYYTSFIKYMQTILIKPFQKFGVLKLSNEPPLVSITRQIIAQQACDFELDECINNKLKFNLLDMRPVYFSMKLKKGDRNMFNKVKNLLQQTEDTVVRADYISSLGYFKDKNALTFLLWHTIQNNEHFKLDKSERELFIKSVYKNSEIGLELTLNFILINWEDLNENLPSNSLEKIIEDISNYVLKDDHIKVFNQLIERFKMSTIYEKCKRNIFQYLEWDLINTESITNWLKTNYHNEPKSNSGHMINSGLFWLLFMILCLLLK